MAEERMCEGQNQGGRGGAAAMRRLGWVLALAVGLGALLAAGPAAARKGKKDKKKNVPIGEVAGRVIDQTGAPLAGVRVTAAPADGGGEAVETFTDKEGGFELSFEDPEPSYLFVLSKEGFQGFEGAIAVDAGMRQEVEFRLIDEGLGKRRDAGIAYNEGVEAFQAGDQATAREKFEQALALDPELLQAYLGLADLYYREREDEKAARAIERYLEQKAEDPQALRLAYSVHRRRGDDERADELLASIRGTPLARTIAVAEYNEGVAAQGEDVEAAISRFESALDIDPALAAARLGLASLYFNHERFDAALEEVRQFLEAEPDHPQGRRLLFLVQDAMADPAAAEAFESYLELEPDEALDLLYRRAELDFRGGELASAEKALLRILREKPDLPEANYTLGLCYASSDDRAKAKEYLQKFLSLAPDHPEAAAAREMLSYF